MDSFKQMIETREDLQKYLFIRGFLLTDEELDLSVFPFYGHWNKIQIGKYAAYTHELQKVYFYSERTKSFFLFEDFVIPTMLITAKINPTAAKPIAAKLLIIFKIKIEIPATIETKERIRNTKENQIIVENTHEPIVDIETFNKCHMLKEGFKNNRNRKYDDIFKGLIYCKDCGSISTLKHKEKSTKSGGKCEINSYICSEANKGISKKCNNTKSISSKKLYKMIIPIIEKECKKVTFNDNDIKKVMNNLENSINYECHRFEEEKQRLSIKIDKLNEQIKITYNDKLENIINNETFLSIKEQRENEIENCKKQIIDLDNKIKIEKSKYTISYNQIKKLSDEFLNSTNINKQLLYKLIDKIEFDSNRNIKLKLIFSNINSE